MKYIKTIHDRVRLAISKETGRYYTPEQVDSEIHAVSLNVFKKYIAVAGASQSVSSFLDPLMVLITLELPTDPVSDVFDLPDRFKYPLLLTKEDGTNIEILETSFWATRVKDPLFLPEDDYPIAKIENGKLRVLPAEIAKVYIEYYKLPTAPVYSYAKDGTKYTYNDENSVDMEWDEEVQDEIVNRALANLGIGTREESLVQFSGQKQQTENA